MRILLPLALLLAATSYPAGAEEQPDPTDPRYLPDILDCAQLHWMRNCQTVNRQIKENPGAPVRIVDPSGLEFQFAPGTPTAVIYHMLSPSAESARRLADYYQAHFDRADQAAALMRDELVRRGGTLASEGWGAASGFAEEAGAPPLVNWALLPGAGSAVSRTASIPLQAVSIDYEAVTVFVFYDTNCPYCQQLFPELRYLQDAHPQLRLRLLQVNEDATGLQAVTTNYALPARLLEGQHREDLLPRIRRTPTIWIQNTRTGQTQVLESFATADDLAQMIGGAS